MLSWGKQTDVSWNSLLFILFISLLGDEICLLLRSIRTIVQYKYIFFLNILLSLNLVCGSHTKQKCAVYFRPVFSLDEISFRYFTIVF